MNSAVSVLLPALIVVGLCAPLKAAARDRGTHLYDLSADTLPVDESEIGVFWARYSRGLAKDFQLATHVAGDAIGVINVLAKYRFLDRPELRASIEGGVIWAASLLLLSEGGDAPILLFVPIELRATVPLDEKLELNLAWMYRGSLTSGAGSAFGISTLRAEATLVRYDQRGAWFLTGRFPLVSRADVKLDSLLGKSDVVGAIALDDLPSWGFLGGRDLTFGTSGHVRLGLGWRNTPGILFYESLGRVLVNVDLYWR